MAPLSILKFTPLGKLHLTQRAPSRMAQRSFARKQSVTQEVPRIKEVAATPPPPVSLASPLVVQTFYRRTGDRFLRPHFPFSTLQDKEIWALFFPALLALLLEPVQALIDTAIVGHLGVAELGAVGFGTLIFQFALGFFASLIFATTPLVASHAANKDLPGASRTAAHGVWVAFILGILLQFFVWTGAPDIMAFLSPNTQVAGLAVAYLRARSWGIPAALIMMVGIGAARGHKEMEGPFVGSAAYGVVLGLLDLLFVFGLKAGVDGAGAAAAVAQWVGAAAIMYVLARRGEFNGADLRSLPGIAAVVPYAAMAPSLALNSMAALAPMVMATSITTGLGPDQLAAHTVLRQLSAFWLQAFLAFNATAHSLVASALGSAQRSMGMDKAAAGLERICQLAVAMSVPLALILFGARAGLPAIFTADAAVVADVSAVLPLLLLTMPLDAMGTALEGGILGAADTRWIAMRTFASSMLSLGALQATASGKGSLAVVWICLKLLNWAALGCDLARFMAPVVRVSPRTVRSAKD